MIKLCATCGTSYDDRGNTLNHCRICEDERQYVPASGQVWINPDDLTETHTNTWQDGTEICNRSARVSAAHAAGEYSLGLHRQS